MDDQWKAACIAHPLVSFITMHHGGDMNHKTPRFFSESS